MSQHDGDAEKAGREASDILSSLCHILSALRPLCGWLWWGHIQENKNCDFHTLIIGDAADNWTEVRGESLQTCGLTGKDDIAARNGYHWSVNETCQRLEQLVTLKVEVKPKYFVFFTPPRFSVNVVSKH